MSAQTDAATVREALRQARDKQVTFAGVVGANALIDDGLAALARLEAAAARAETLEAALRRVAHHPFDVVGDAESDLRAVKDIATAALEAVE